MNENVENLILKQLRDIRAAMAASEYDTDRRDHKVHARFGELRTMIGGHSTKLTALAGNIHGIAERVEKLELSPRV